MEVLTTLLPLAAPLRLLWTTFRRVRAGASVPLIAGGSTEIAHNNNGMLAIAINMPGSHIAWYDGSAYNLSRNILYVWRY